MNRRSPNPDCHELHEGQVMREWYFQAMGQELGPFSVAELKSKVEGGQIQVDTMVRRGTEGKWVFAEKVKGLIPTAPEPALPPPPAKSKSSATMPVYGGSGAQASATAHAARAGQWSAEASSSRQPPVITIPLIGDENSDDSAQAPSSEFYEFVGFREAISPVLHRAVRQYLADHHLTMTQLNRRALAAFIARPELASDLMISNMAVIAQVVNDKSNANGSDPLTDRERMENATFRLTLFNCSNRTLNVTQGEFVPETVDVRDYEEVGTKALPAIDHKGHVPIRLDGVQPGHAIPFSINVTIAPLAAENLTVWFRSSHKPSLTTIRGRLQLGEGDELALSESFKIFMHGDSP